MQRYQYLIGVIIGFALVLIPTHYVHAQSTPGISLGVISGATTEAGGKATFMVVLTTKPSANVILGLVSSDPMEGKLAVAAVTLSSANWNVPQTVAVTGVDDGDDDGDLLYTIITTPAISTDPTYNGANPADVTVINQDNDAAGFMITPISGDTTEAGGTATFTVKLSSRPQRNVNLGLTSSDLTEGTLSSGLLVFTPANWNTAQTVTVRGVDDPIADGKITYTIITAAAISGDSKYNGVDPANIPVFNVNNDTVSFVISPTAPMTTTEVGGTASFTIVPTSRPSADVTIN